MYVIKGGFRDGFAGFIIAGLGALYVFLKEAKLWERHQLRLRGLDPDSMPRYARATSPIATAASSSWSGSASHVSSSAIITPV